MTLIPKLQVPIANSLDEDGSTILRPPNLMDGCHYWALGKEIPSLSGLSLSLTKTKVELS